MIWILNRGQIIGNKPIITIATLTLHYLVFSNAVLKPLLRDVGSCSIGFETCFKQILFALVSMAKEEIRISAPSQQKNIYAGHYINAKVQ